MDLPLAVPVGDPAGVGPEVAVRAASEAAPKRRLVLFGDAEQLLEIARRQGCDHFFERLPADGSVPGQLGRVWLADTGRLAADIVAQRSPSREGGQAQWEALERATDMVLAGQARALVTGPVSKAAIVLAGHSFVGQTEYLAQRAGLADEDVTMMFLGSTLRVALVTTHLSLRAVSDAIVEQVVERSISHLARALLDLSVRAPVRIGVSGLNPHAGEGGLFGDEDAAVIAPAIQRAAQALGASADVRGPVPAEAVFRQAQALSVDGVVAMFHDQATIASKLLDWGSAVNVTWGLPFVRTSVDHGVAYDAAREGTASAEGMRAALDMAHRLTTAGVTSSPPPGLQSPRA